MPVPYHANVLDKMLVAVSTATISSGFTVSVPSPTRGELRAVYLGPVDGATPITGTATLTLTVGGVSSGATVGCTAAAAGLASGSNLAAGNGISGARQIVAEGDCIKAVLGAGLTCAQNAVLLFVVRARSA